MWYACKGKHNHEIGFVDQYCPSQISCIIAIVLVGHIFSYHFQLSFIVRIIHLVHELLRDVDDSPNLYPILDKPVNSLAMPTVVTLDCLILWTLWLSLAGMVLVGLPKMLRPARQVFLTR